MLQDAKTYIETPTHRVKSNVKSFNTPFSSIEKVCTRDSNTIPLNLKCCDRYTPLTISSLSQHYSYVYQYIKKNSAKNIISIPHSPPPP